MVETIDRSTKKSRYRKTRRKTYGNLIAIIVVIVLLLVLFSGIFSICSWDGNEYTEIKLTWGVLFNSIKTMVTI